MKSRVFAISSSLIVVAGALSAQPVPNTTIPDSGSTSPAFGVHEYQPLSVDDKFRLYLHETFGPAALGKTAFLGAISASRGGAGDWGPGADGRMRRMESVAALHLTRHTLEFAGDAALHIDPRYRRSDSTGFGPRLRHALASPVVAYTDTGARTVAIPRIGSAYGSAFASNLWYPQDQNGWQDAIVRGSAYLGWTACKNVANEFWPDIQRALQRRRHSP